MNITAERENIDRCRFCFMCRHVCTLGRVTNEEALTPRSQALGLSMIIRGTIGYEKDLVENIYKCCLCGYCKDWCQGGWDFPSSVKAARADIVNQKQAPAFVVHLKDEIEKNKNTYRKESRSAKINKKIKEYSKNNENLLIFGSEVLYGAPEIGLNFMDILKKSRIGFMTIAEEDTSSYDLRILGYLEEAKASARKLTEKIKATGCKKIFVLSADVESFLTKELSALECDLGGIEIVGGVKLIHELIQKGHIVIKKEYKRTLTYHDCNSLARETGIINEPREIIENIPSCTYNEMIWNKNEAHSTGSNLVNRLFPEVARQIVEKRVEDVKEIEAEILVTSSAYDKIRFSEIFKNKKVVVDIFELVNELI